MQQDSARHTPAPAGSRSSRIGGQSLGLPIFYGRLPSRCLWLGLALGSPNPSTVDSELGSPEDCPGPAPVDSAPAAKAPESGRLGVREPAVASGAPNPWREKRTPKKTGAIRAKEGSPAKKPKLAKPAKGEDMGYDLSRVRPKRSVPKSKVAVDETYVEATSKQDFITRCTNSRVSGGKRSTVCGERTAEMHWRQIRMYLGWIQAPQGAHIRDHLNIKDLTKALKHMETQPTIRKSPFKPGSVQLLSRSLSVAIQVFLVDRPLRGPREQRPVTARIWRVGACAPNLSIREPAVDSRAPNLSKPVDAGTEKTQGFDTSRQSRPSSAP